MHGRGHAWWGVYVAGGMCGGGHVCQGGAWQGACMAGDKATAVNSTHLTGMHSCLLLYFN